MKPSNSVKAWLVENYTRLKLKTPKVFQVWQTIGVILLLVTGIPEFLKQLYEETGIDVWTMLPDAVKVLASKTIAVAGLVIKIMSKLHVISTEVAKNNENLPYTEANK